MSRAVRDMGNDAAGSERFYAAGARLFSFSPPRKKNL